MLHHGIKSHLQVLRNCSGEMRQKEGEDRALPACRKRANKIKTAKIYKSKREKTNMRK